MRIGIDCRLWNESGVGRYIRNLVKNLGEIDRENEYVLFVRTNDVENFKFQISNFKFQIVKADIRWHTIEEQLIFPLILNKEKLDLVHFPYFSVPIFYPGNFIVTIHDLIPLHFDTGRATTLPQPLYRLKKLGYKFIIKKAAEKAAKILTVSNATKEEIVKHLGVNENKVVVTHEGASLGERGKGKGGTIPYTLYPIPFFLYVGNAYPHKNLERLLKALGILVSKCPSISLVLVGKEDYFYKRLKEQIKKMRLVNNVIFYGEVTDEELGFLYQNAKALVIPSLMEGFGLPALEAMANGCLVLASDIPAIREVCGQTAIYFNPYDPKDIAKKMKNIDFDYSNNRTKISEGQKITKRFSWQNLARKTLKVYQSI